MGEVLAQGAEQGLGLVLGSDGNVSVTKTLVEGLLKMQGGPVEPFQGEGD